MTAWADLMAAGCIGVTQSGDRCGRRDSGRASDPDVVEVWLCHDHSHQMPGARAVQAARRDAARRVANFADRLAVSVVTDRVYFMSDGRAMKIGTSERPTQRLASLRTLTNDGTRCPDDLDRAALVLLLDIPGGRALERQFHQIARRWRITGEWFRDCIDLRDELANYGVHLAQAT